MIKFLHRTAFIHKSMEPKDFNKGVDQSSVLTQQNNYECCLMLISSMSKISVPRVEPSPFARRVGLKIVVNSLCRSKKLGGIGSCDVFWYPCDGGMITRRRPPTLMDFTAASIPGITCKIHIILWLEYHPHNVSTNEHPIKFILLNAKTKTMGMDNIQGTQNA